MVIGGAANCGLGNLVEGSNGQPADFDTAFAVSWAEGTDVVDVVGLVVVVVDDVDLDHGLVTRRERPTTTTTAMAVLILRRSPFLRLAAFCSASRRAWRPAF
jgi:hypothetical protein